MWVPGCFVYLVGDYLECCAMVRQRSAPRDPADQLCAHRAGRGSDADAVGRDVHVDGVGGWLDRDWNGNGTLDKRSSK